MSWRVKQFIRKWGPIALMALVAWVGLTHYQRGGRANIGSVMTSTRVAVGRIPVLGSMFKGRSFSYHSGRSYAYSKGRRYGHRSHRRHHRRGRRR